MHLEGELGTAPRRGAAVEIEAPVGELGAVVVHLLDDEHPAPLNGVGDIDENARELGKRSIVSSPATVLAPIRRRRHLLSSIA